MEICKYYPEHGGFFSGKVRVNEKIYGVITAPKEEGQFSGVWLPERGGVYGADSFFDSRANTIVMAGAGVSIAQRALNATIHGFSDWAIPARDVLEIQYRAHKPTPENNCDYRSGDNPSSVPAGYPYSKAVPAQCFDPLFQKGGVEAFGDAWCWSSTQSSTSCAWSQDFCDGYQGTCDGYGEGLVRLIRLISLPD